MGKHSLSSKCLAEALATDEGLRLTLDGERQVDWKRFGPYLSERQWGTVREDYSKDGSAWEYFSHEDSRKRAYRWGEDGLLGITDRQCRLCFGLALWNGQDPFLKERLFGVTNPEGNHGEDVKEYYFYLDSTPTHSYMKALYKYPQREFPYKELVEENQSRSRAELEYELADTGVFDDNRYFDVQAEYAKASPNDILIKITVTNRAPEAASLKLLAQLWFRNTWSWGRHSDGYFPEPQIKAVSPSSMLARHSSLGNFYLDSEPAKKAASAPCETIFTDNESNMEELFHVASHSAHVKDAFHKYVVQGDKQAVRQTKSGTKAAFLETMQLAPGASQVLSFRLTLEEEHQDKPFSDFDEIFSLRKQEADDFYKCVIPQNLSKDIQEINRQAYASLLWSKQFYYYVVKEWLEGDPNAPPPLRINPRNKKWAHSFNRDIICMPDKWEYPWYAIWDTAFHMVVMARIDPYFAKEQLILFLREWYMHHDGQMPAYEFNLSDVNPPVHAWAAYRVYKMTAQKGERDRLFLIRVFQKLLINFSWWVNRKDLDGNDLFGGGFLGLDNIGLFDRSHPDQFPLGGILEQADGTAWMSFYCTSMLGIALELAFQNNAFEDIASKFFEHYIQISDALNFADGCGMWCEQDGFYYDKLVVGKESIPLRIRSIVGLMPMIAVEVLREDDLKQLQGFYKRMQWFIKHKKDLDSNLVDTKSSVHGELRLLSLLSEKRLRSLLTYMLDEEEFLSPYGIRSLSKIHEKEPYTFHTTGTTYSVGYVPGESTSGDFGGNSNWRGPIWFPLNFLIIEALERYHKFYGDLFLVECPTGSGNMCTLKEVSCELGRRLATIFLPDSAGLRPWQKSQEHLFAKPDFKDLHLFYEHFHADSGRGLGASHQTGWTALVTRLFDDFARLNAEVQKESEHGSDVKSAKGAQGR